jgi:hypothetical protein
MGGVQRVGTLPVQEPSEEIRLAHVRLYLRLLESRDPHVLGPHAADVSKLITCALADPYPEVKKVQFDPHLQ